MTYSLQKISAFIKISRPLNFLITFFSVLIAAVISIEDEYSWTKIFLAALSAGLTASSGNVINDYFDIEIDKVNKPGRVLPQGLLSLKETLVFYIVLIFAALFISAFISRIAFVEVFFASFLLYFYSYLFKKIPLFGNFIISFLTGFAFVYGGMSVGNAEFAFVPALFAFLINFVREIIKDMEDVAGDKKEGIKTFPMIYGYGKSRTLVLILTAGLILFTAYPFAVNLFSIEYFIFVMAVVNPLLVYVVKSLYENDSVKNLNNLSFILKLNMVFGLIAIYLGK